MRFVAFDILTVKCGYFVLIVKKAESITIIKTYKNKALGLIFRLKTTISSKP